MSESRICDYWRVQPWPTWHLDHRTLRFAISCEKSSEMWFRKSFVSVCHDLNSVVSWKLLSRCRRTVTRAYHFPIYYYSINRWKNRNQSHHDTQCSAHKTLIWITHLEILLLIFLQKYRLSFLQKYLLSSPKYLLSLKCPLWKSVPLLSETALEHTHLHDKTLW